MQDYPPHLIAAMILSAIGIMAALITAIVAYKKSRPDILNGIMDAAQKSLNLSRLLHENMVEELNGMQHKMQTYKDSWETSATESTKITKELTYKVELLIDAIKSLIAQLERMGMDPDCSQEVLDLLSD